MEYIARWKKQMQGAFDQVRCGARPAANCTIVQVTDPENRRLKIEMGEAVRARMKLRGVYHEA
jgi:hypothetical protein